MADGIVMGLASKNFYQAVAAKLGHAGQLTLSDIEPSAHPGVATAILHANSYLVSHCGSS